jgi:predicted acyltransferase
VRDVTILPVSLTAPQHVRQPLTLPDIDTAPPPPPLAPRSQRLASLDIFRGITIAAMLLVNNPGSWSHVYGPLRHADWHGWTPTDLIFPFFLFIVGVAIPFSLSKRASEKDVSRATLLGGIWARALALVMLGLLLQGLPSGNFDALPPGRFQMLEALRLGTFFVIFAGFALLLYPWKSKAVAMIVPLAVAIACGVLYAEIFFVTKKAIASGALPANFNFGSGVLTPWKMRFPGVLQRIGVCYGVGATIALFAGWRTVLAAAVLFMTIYSVAMLAGGSLDREGNLARQIDVKVFRDHNYRAYPDPEGLLSTLPAIGSVLLGVLVGLGLRNKDATPPEKAARLLFWGVVTSILGVLLGWWLMPINKQIWTPSFTVFTAGMAMLGLGAVYYAADVRGRRLWALPFTIYGMNAIFAFVLAGVAGRLLALVKVGEADTPVLSYFYRNVLEPNITPAANASLVYAIAFVLVFLAIMTVLYLLKIFIKV